jgi:hypothetical protein
MTDETRSWTGKVVIEYEVENPGRRSHRKAAERFADHLLADPQLVLVIEDEDGARSEWAFDKDGQELRFLRGQGEQK